MNGKVKVCKKILQDKIESVQYFDVDGRLIKEEENDYDKGVLKLVKIFKYENESISRETFNAEEILIGRNLKKLNKEGKVEEEYNGIGNDRNKYCYKYDQNQKLSTITRLDSDNKIGSTSVYDLTGSDEYTKHYNSSGLLKSFEILKFNEKKQLIRAINFEEPAMTHENPDEFQCFQEYFEMMKAFSLDIKGTEIDIPLSIEFLVSNVIYQYDKFGNKISQEKFEYNKESSINQLVCVSGNYYEYNELNLVVRYTSYEIHTDWDDKWQNDYKYSFDEKGNMIEKIMENGFNKIIEKFSYDDSGKLVYYIEDRNDNEETTEKFYDDNSNQILEIRKCNYDDEYEEEITKYEIEYY